MQTNDLRNLDDAALEEHILTQRRELFGLLFQHATGSLENTSTLRNAKREIARALTIARQRGTTTTTTEN